MSQIDLKNIIAKEVTDELLKMAALLGRIAAEEAYNTATFPNLRCLTKQEGACDDKQ